MNTYLLCIILLAVGAVCSRCATQRGRNPRVWFFLGFLFGLIGLVTLLLLPPIRKQQRTGAIARGSSPAGSAPPVNKKTLELLDPTHTDKLWYYLDNTHQQYGPMSINALCRAWEEGKVSTTTYVWNENLTDWKTFDQVLKPL